MVWHPSSSSSRQMAQLCNETKHTLEINWDFRSDKVLPRGRTFSSCQGLWRLFQFFRLAPTIIRMSCYRRQLNLRNHRHRLTSRVAFSEPCNVLSTAK